MRMSAERGKIADDVSVSDPTVSQRHFRFYMKLHKAFVGKLSKKSLGNKL